MTSPAAFGRDVDLIAFDLDNTLYDEGQYFEAAFTEIVPHLAERSGRPAREIGRRLREILTAHGKHYHHLFSDILAEIGLDPKKDLPPVLDLFRGVRTTLTPFPEVVDLLRDLRPRYRLGLITSGMRAVQENKLRLLEIASYFEEIVYSSTLRENKPSPVPFRHLLERVGVSASRAVYVGDNPLFDFRGANAIGMLTIRVRNAEFDSMEVAAADDGQLRIEHVGELRRLSLSANLS